MKQQPNHRAFASLKTGVSTNTNSNNNGVLSSPSSTSLLSSNSSSSSSTTLLAPTQQNTTYGGSSLVINQNNIQSYYIQCHKTSKKINYKKKLKPPKVFIIKRNIRTCSLSIPEQNLLDCARHVREMVNTYTRDWLVVDLFDSDNIKDISKLQHNFGYSSDHSDSSSDNTSSKSLIVYDEEVITSNKTSTTSLHRAASAPSAPYNLLSAVSSSKHYNSNAHPKQPLPAPSGLKNNCPSANSTMIPPLLDDVLHYDKNFKQKQNLNNNLRQRTKLFSLYKIENSNFSANSFTNIPSIPCDYTGMHHFCRLLVECIQLECSDTGTTQQDSISGYVTSDSLTSQSSNGTNQSTLSIQNLSGHMALYDLRTKRKLTENYYLNLHNQNSVIRHQNACVIDIPKNSKNNAVHGEDLFLVIRLEKPLQGKQRNENSISHTTSLDKASVHYKTPYAWTAVHLADVFGTNHKSSSSMDSLDRNNVNLNSTNSLDSRFGLGEFERFRKKWSGPSGQTDHHLVTATMVQHRGSLDRRSSNQSSIIPNENSIKNIETTATMDRLIKNTNSKQRRYSWSEEDFLCNSGSVQNISDSTHHCRNFRYPTSVDNNIPDFRPLTLTINGFFKQETDKLKDEDLYKLLHELKCQTWSGNTGDQYSSNISGTSCHSGTSSLLSNNTSSPGGIGILASKKLKNLNPTNHNGSSPTCIKLDISLFSTEDNSLENVFTSDLLPLASKNKHCNKELENEKTASIVRELLEFPFIIHSISNSNPTTIDITTPNYVYRNLLFIYPKELNLTSRTGSARNITVKIQLMCGEQQPVDAMYAIFKGDGGYIENNSKNCFTNEAYTSITYHQRWPSFYDEIKIKLPADIHGRGGDGMDKNGSKNYHLLFTFYHVSCSKGKDGDKKTSVGQNSRLETPVGYTWLPLLKDRALVEGEYSLPVALHPIDPILANYSYITADVALPGIEWLDNHKPHFVVYLKPVSSIHPSDSALNSFFSFCSLLEPLMNNGGNNDKLPRRLAESNIEAELKHRITNLTKAAMRPLVQYIHVVLDKLFTLLIEPPRCMNSTGTMDIGSSVFHTLQQLISMITKEQNGNEILQSYIKYHYCCVILTKEESDGIGLENYFDLEKISVDSLSTDSSPLIDKEIVSSFSDSVFKAYSTSLKKKSENIIKTNNPHHNEKIKKCVTALNKLQTLQQCIIEQWTLCTDVRIAAATDSTFFFDAIVKCIALGVTLCYDENQINKTPSIAKFTEQFLQDLHVILIHFYKNIAECITTLDSGNNYLDRIKLLNKNIAKFLKDLLVVFVSDDNGLKYVYGLIEEYISIMATKQKLNNNNGRPYSILSSLKLDFLRILSDHQYYTELNLLNNSDDEIFLTDLCIEYKKKHYLSSLVLQEFIEVLKSPYNDSKVKEKSTELIIWLLQKHDLKIGDSNVAIAWLYIPILSAFLKDKVLLDALLSHEDKSDEKDFNSNVDDDNIKRRSSHRTVSFEAISSSNIASVKAAIKFKSTFISEKTIKNILATILWILKNSEEENAEDLNNEPFTQYLISLSPLYSNNLLTLMSLCVEHFKYTAYNDGNININYKKKNAVPKLSKSLSLHCPTSSPNVSSYSSLPLSSNQSQPNSSTGNMSIPPLKSVDDVKSRLEDVILGRQGARNDLMERRKSSTNSNSKVRWNKDLMHYHTNTSASASQNVVKQFNYCSKSNKCSEKINYDLYIDNMLANEIGFIILNILEKVIKVSSRNAKLNIQFSMNTVPSTVRLAFKVLLKALRTYQYQTYPSNCNKGSFIGALKKTFEIIRTTVAQYPRLLFIHREQSYEDDGDSGCDCEFIDNNECNDLLQKTCLVIMRHFYITEGKCSCNEDTILMQASATYYWLMRVSYELDNNFARVKMYGALALSCILEKSGVEDQWYCTNIDAQRYKGIKLALQIVMRYGENDDISSFNEVSTTLNTVTFNEQVKESIDGMFKVIKYMNKIYEVIKHNNYVGDTSLIMNPSLLISSEDSQMLLEFMYSIACGYQQASACLMPQLRLRWLKRMANVHVKNGNHCEAAMCCISGTALLCEYLKRSDDGNHNLSVYKGAACLEYISPNVLVEESAVSDDLFMEENNDLYEICEKILLEEQVEGSTSYYSLLDLITIELQKAVDFLWKATMYEKMAKIYNKLLIPLIELGYGNNTNEDLGRYERLADAYGKLKEAYVNLDKKEKKTKPSSETYNDCTYFRVGIYYNGMSDVDESNSESNEESTDLAFCGKQYIYKEPQLTKLSEIFDRLQSHYSEKYGAENVIAVKHSNRISGESIDNKKKVYIQITYVEPCTAPSLRLASHSIYSNKNNEDVENIKRFVYSTPFTLDDDGRTHACQLRDQYKRKTLLTTERSFPYILTRIPVMKSSTNMAISRNVTPSRRSVEHNCGDNMEVVVMQPIEVAIEDLQKKTQELSRSINQSPADAKMLQMVLQGCIGTTVNCGPMEMATVFLSQQQNLSSQNSKTITRLRNKLRLCFKNFSKKCADALEKNRGLIGPDQRQYQQELERNYTRFSEQLAPLLISSYNNGQ
ncbi:dedicator of cytokinesis protein 7 [Daktulosphaira vitifoliae]|uniref:dedicator of cytokinesis protein 7 n=1 Tax=Daktulosphaira vitifoliae TaxID=58002 RepID=UPI0021AA61C1|nr:dedicator of cytokinesis protein 7 [Daktulosphaira vitifoliae]